MKRANEKKDIILINPQAPGEINDTNVGLAVLESYLTHKGVNCVTSQGQEIENYIDRSDVFGISVLDGTYLSARSLTRRLDGKTVVWGGWTPTAIPEFILRENQGVDYIILREGEDRLLNLLRSFENQEEFDDIDGIAYRDEKGEILVRPPVKFVDMDKLPIPTEMAILNKIVFVELARGCYGRCGYCQEASKMRFKSVERVTNEIVHWYAKGYRSFYLGNADSMANGKLLSGLLKNIEKAELVVNLYTVGRPDDVLRNYGAIEKYFKSKAVHLAMIEIGIESNAQHAIDLLRRRTTPEINCKAISSLLDLKNKYSPETDIHANIILFSHFDMSIDDFVENVRFIGDYRCSKNAIVPRLEGVANTPIWREMKARGFKSNDNAGMRIYDYPFTDKDVDMLFEKMLRAPAESPLGHNIVSREGVLEMRKVYEKILEFYDSGNIKEAVGKYLTDEGHGRYNTQSGKSCLSAFAYRQVENNLDTQILK